MNVSQEIRNTLAKSGEPMTVAQIADAIGGLADAKFVQAICIQHTKKGAFARKMEDGQLVYWMVDQGNAANQAAHATPALEEKGADSKPVAQPELLARPQVAAAKAERPKRTPAIASETLKDPMHPFVTDAPGKDVASTTTQLNAAVRDLQSERILRMERTSHNLQRLLSTLLGDAIDAQLEHDVLRRLSTAQLAVQDVHGYLVNVG